MPLPGQLQRFVGKVSATLELTCFEYECSAISDLLQVQPTWTSPLHFSSSTHLPAPWKNGCAWHYDTARSVSSTNVSEHVQHLLSVFLPIKSRVEEMRPSPLINISVYWECSAFGVTGMTGPQFTADDLKGMAELGATLEVKVIEKNEIRAG